MTVLTARILWTPVSPDVHSGYVGSLPLFTVEKLTGDRPWKLATTLPLPFNYSGGRDLDSAKTVAEKLLAAFVTRLGATFP